MGSFVKWLCLALLPVVLAQDYCSVCTDHTMCAFKGKGTSCGGNSVSGMSSAEAAQIVDLHNYYRARIANGLENRGKSGAQPPAANMQALAWDEKLAEVAQRWADQCTFQHDRCRHDPRFKVGQNIYFSSGLPSVNWTRAIGAWYDEVKHFDGHSVGRFRLDHYTGHYSQLAWASTTVVGCARTTFGEVRRLDGHRPREFVLSASPSEPEVKAVEKNGSQRVKKQSGLGFFGGASFDPSGAQGAITGTSGGAAGSPGANRPSRPPSGHFPGNGIGSGNRPNYPGTDYRPAYPNYPSYPSYPDFPEGSDDESDYEQYYTGPGGYYPGNYYLSHPAYQRPSLHRPVYPPAGFAPYFIGYSETNGFPSRPSRPEALGFFNAEADESLPLPPAGTKPDQLYLPTYAEWENKRINRRQSVEPGKEPTYPAASSASDVHGRDQILICNYGPAGNYVNQPMYIEGKPCSKCPLGTTCRKGLCTTI